MGLFRDRAGSPRWLLFGPRPQPRRARGMDSPESPATPSEPLDDEVADTGSYGAEGDETQGSSAVSRSPEPTPSQRYPGLPALSAAEARARNGRGFAAIIMRRRRKAHRHDHAAHGALVDLATVETALGAAAGSLGPGLDQAVVWDARTGLALAGRGDAYERLAPVWQRALRDVQAALPEARLPGPGPQHLVGLRGGRIAILLHASSALGAALTVRPDLVDLDDVMGSAVPTLRAALVSASREN